MDYAVQLSKHHQSIAKKNLKERSSVPPSHFHSRMISLD
jgi:hypothetical protein